MHAHSSCCGNSCLHIHPSSTITRDHLVSAEVRALLVLWLLAQVLKIWASSSSSFGDPGLPQQHCCWRPYGSLPGPAWRGGNVSRGRGRYSQAPGLMMSKRGPLTPGPPKRCGCCHQAENVGPEPGPESHAVLHRAWKLPLYPAAPDADESSQKPHESVADATKTLKYP